jgi:Zn-dependent peptidase ImmA (M78 family)
VTILAHGKKLIIVNSDHGRARQNSSIMHELAHLILDHDAARVDVSPQGLMLLDTYDKAQEAEADWFAGALLVPREALLAFFAADPSLERAAAHFGASVPLIRMRRDMTGIERQLTRRANT